MKAIYKIMGLATHRVWYFVATPDEALTKAKQICRHEDITEPEIVVNVREPVALFGLLAQHPELWERLSEQDRKELVLDYDRSLDNANSKPTAKLDSLRAGK